MLELLDQRCHHMGICRLRYLHYQQQNFTCAVVVTHALRSHHPHSRNQWIVALHEKLELCSEEKQKSFHRPDCTPYHWNCELLHRILVHFVSHILSVNSLQTEGQL